MPSREVLVLSYAMPPLALPEAQLCAKSLSRLPGYDVDVISAAAVFKWIRHDRSLEAYIEGGFRSVHRLASPGLLRRAAFILIPGLRDTPDAMRSLNARALRLAESLDPGRYAAVLSWSQWHSVHLVALALKRRYPRLAWIAHFSDPWIGNPFDRRSKVVEALNKRLVDKVMAKADALVFTTQGASDLACAPYGATVSAKACVIPHPYDPTLYPRAHAVVGVALKRVVMSYIGTFYGPRRPDPAFLGMRRLLDRRPDLKGRVMLRLIGSAPAPILQAVKACGLSSDEVEVPPPVDYLPSLEMMAASDILLVIDASFASSPFLPSKMVDYLGADKPILAITPPGGAAGLARRLGCPVASPDDPEAVAAAMEMLVTRVLGGDTRLAGPDRPDLSEIRQQYEVDRIRSRYRDLIASLASW